MSLSKLERLKWGQERYPMTNNLTERDINESNKALTMSPSHLYPHHFSHHLLETHVHVDLIMRIYSKSLKLFPIERWENV